MKKNRLLVLALFISAGSFAQNKNVVSAINYLNYYSKDMKCDDLKEAKTFIDLAAQHEDTKSSAKMWFNRGQIYQLILESQDSKCNTLSDAAVNETMTSYQNALKFDEKKTYSEQIKQKASVFQRGVFNKALTSFNAGDYKNAIGNFELSNQVSLSFFNKLDSGSVFNAYLSAEKAKNNAKAIELLPKLIDMQYGLPKEPKVNASLYSSLAYFYETAGDTANFLKTIAAGKKKYPYEFTLINQETDYYLKSGNDTKALENLKLAIEKSPDNPQIFLVAGNIYDRMANPKDNAGKELAQPKNYEELFGNAEKYYKKAIELAPKNGDATYVLGILYYNKAVKINDDANNIADNNRYKKEVAKADEFFKLAVPYLEKAHELNPKDKNTMYALKQLYARTEQKDKYDKINEELKN